MVLTPLTPSSSLWAMLKTEIWSLQASLIWLKAPYVIFMIMKYYEDVDGDDDDDDD